MKRLLALLLAALMCLGMFAACKSDKTNSLEDAKEYLDTIMKAQPENTPSDYTVLGKVMIGKEEFTVTWSVDVTENVKVVVAEDGTVTIDVNEKAAADVAYVLTATIANAAGKTIVTSYNRKLPQFKELTWAEFVATEDDAPVVIKGVITGIINTETKHELYLEDKDGGYYVYNLDPAIVKMDELAIGMEIRVSGIRDTYYGVNQVINASVEVLNATPAPVVPKDITTAVLEADSLKDAALLKLQSTLVTIQGVTVIGQDSKNDTYFNFSIDGKLSYVRISGSANMLSDEDTATFKKNVADNVGKGATVTGLVSIYNNQIYLIPVTVDAYKDFAIIERTPEEQTKFEADIFEAPGTITEAGEITLSTAVKLYTDVKISWALAATDYATLAENKLTVATLPDEAQTIQLTATFTNGDKSTSKTYTVKIEAAAKLVPDMVTEPVAETLYKFYIKQYNTKQTLYFAGTETGTSGATLLYTTDPTKAVDVGLEAVPEKPGEYYFFYMVGTAKNYIIISAKEDGSGYVISTNRRSLGSNTYVYNEEFDMLTTTVKIGENDNTYWFGTYSTNAKIGISAISYINAGNYNVSQFPAHFGTLVDVDSKTDAEKVAREKNDLSIQTAFNELGGSVKLPAFGDMFAKVAITWTAEANPAVVIENGVLTAVPQAEDATVKVTATIQHGTVTETKEFTVTVAKKTGIEYTTIPAFNEIALKQPDKGATTEEKYLVQGVVVEVKSTQYGNMYIQDAEGNKLYVYGLYDATGANRYDAMGEKAPKVGDTVILLGVAGNYNGAQMKNGWLQICIAGEPEVENPDEPKAVTIPAFNEIALAQPDKGATTTEKYLVQGVIVEIKSTQYGNMYIQDAEGNKLYIYGLYDATGANRYDAMGDKAPKVGDLITVLGVAGNYNGAQMKNGWMVAHTAATTITAFNEIALAQPDKGATTEAKYLVQGEIVEIKSTQYGNMYIQDAEGNKLYIYGLYDATGATRYDAMGEKAPKVGDTITVLGVAGNYNGAQMKNAWLIANTCTGLISPVV